MEGEGVHRRAVHWGKDSSQAQAGRPVKPEDSRTNQGLHRARPGQPAPQAAVRSLPRTFQEGSTSKGQEETHPEGRPRETQGRWEHVGQGQGIEPSLRLSLLTKLSS